MLLTNKYSVRNSVGFIDRVKNVIVEDHETLLSFDVVSLFTSVPTDQVVSLIVDMLSSDNTLLTQTLLSIADIKTGLEICFNSTIFLY